MVLSQRGRQNLALASPKTQGRNEPCACQSGKIQTVLWAIDE